MGFKEFSAELSIARLVQEDTSDLEARLVAIQGRVDLMEDGPTRAMLCNKLHRLQEALKRKSSTTMPRSSNHG
jgi:hypothetical protein